MRKFVLVLGLGMFAATAAAGCSSSSGSGGGGPFKSGVSPTKTGDDLSSAEATQICEAANSYAQESFSQLDPCKFAGVLGAAFVLAFDPDATDASLREGCSAMVEACQSGEGDFADIGEWDDDDNMDCSDVDWANECSATVGEIEACVTDSMNEARAMFNQFPSCNALTRDYLESLEEFEEPEDPQSCQVLEEKCPGLYAHDEGDWGADWGDADEDDDTSDF